MNGTTRLAIAAVAVLAVATGGLYVLNREPGNTGVGGLPQPSLTASPSLAPSVSPSSSAAASPSGSTEWVVYKSDRYGFSISHPADWSVRPASRDWTMAADAMDWLSNAQEVFLPPNQNIRLSAWSVALDPDAVGDETLVEVEAWVEEYCQKTDSAPCTGIHDRAVPLCVERRDCHPGLLVPFNDDVQAFFRGGIYGDRMVVVAVWWGPNDPAVAPYGGSRQLLEAFLSTMEVWPAAVPFEERVVREVPIPAPS